jgi:hypothetical protein
MNFKYYKPERLVIFIIILYFPFSFLSELIERACKRWDMLERIVLDSHSFSTLTLLILAIVFVNKVGWKWSIFKWLIDIPNLNGRYSGELVSSYKDEGGQFVKKTCVVEIRQNASEIHVSSYFSNSGSEAASSSSHSISEAIVKEQNDFFKLYYIFVNDTGFLENEVRNHTGTATFFYYPDVKILEGEYYNQRMNKGTLKVRFIQKKRLGRFIEQI